MAAGIKKQRNKNMDKDLQMGMKEKITEILELPREVILDLPKITMVGLGNIVIENYKGIIEYENNRIRLNTNSGIIRIMGERLVIREITSEDIIIEGRISQLDFLR
jgi:sporulation protein YqfC